MSTAVGVSSLLQFYILFNTLLITGIQVLYIVNYPSWYPGIVYKDVYSNISNYFDSITHRSRRWDVGNLQ